MTVLFDDALPVSYGQFYVISDDDFLDMPESFGGQVNGLCGAAIQGGLFLITGTHTGRVHLRIELHDAEPPDATREWHEVVEVSFVPGEEVRLQAWGGDGDWPLELGDSAAYRVRYCANDMNRNREVEWNEDFEAVANDRYLMQFWPVDDAAPRPDTILRQTTPDAEYWHKFAREQPPPPTPEQKAEAARQAQLERERKAEEYRRQDELRRWHGRAPSERLRQVRGNIFGLVRLDRDLVDKVSEVDPETQRAIARWATRRAYEHAGIANQEWIAPALRALDRGEPLPEPFDDQTRAWERLRQDDDESVEYFSTLELRPFYGEPDPPGMRIPDNIDPVYAALPAIWAAIEADPLQAALEALWAAAVAHGGDRSTFLADVRGAFPGLH